MSNVKGRKDHLGVDVKGRRLFADDGALKAIPWEALCEPDEIELEMIATA